MASRRPTVRSYSGNGRSGSQNGDNAPSPRLDSRNYLSNVRPENRSTFCSVMSQLTEETQPCFETTIKSKAVSEACNVKFTCVVTGYPIPELTWYKDDMELDRYCGLPKYEIFRNGKTHTLHIYNCSVDDAAIYQASARNSKGIVSCSGVLEVGSMSEYKIHQRFFAKLKQKAALKQRELQESQHQDKENVQQEQLGANQDHTLRKLRFFEAPDHNFPFILDGEDNVNHVETILHDAAALDEELNDMSVKAPISQIRSNINKENISQQRGSDISHNHDQQLDQISEKVEIDGIAMFTKEKVSKKKIRVCNGFDNINQSHQGAGDMKNTDEEMSLAKFLTESLQSQTDEEHQKNTIQSLELISTDTNNIQEKELNHLKDKVMEHKKADIHQKQEGFWERHKVDEEQESCWEIEPEKSKKREQEKSKLRERERSKEREKSKERDRETSKERERDITEQREQEKSKLRDREITKEREQGNRKQLDYEYKAVAVSDPKAPAHKDPDHQHKSALSSVFHSLKDIFFGKSKKIPETTDSLKKVSDMDIAKEIPVPNQAEHPHLSQTQPQEPNTTPGVNGSVPEYSVIMEEGQHHQTGDLHVNKEFPQESPPLLQISTGMMNLNLDAHADEVTDGDQLYKAHETHTNVDTRVENSPKIEEVNRVEKEAGPQSLPKILLCEATDDHREAERDESMFDLPHETPGQECSAGMDQMTQASEEMHAVKERDTPDSIQRPSVCLPGPNMTDLEGTESYHEAQLSQLISHASLFILSKFEKNEEISMDKNRADYKALKEDIRVPDVEEIPGQNSLNTREECSLTEGHKDKINVATAGATLSIQNSVTEKLETASLFDRAQGPNKNFLDKSTPELNMSLSITPQNESIMGRDLKQNKSSVSVLVIEEASVGNDKSIEHNTCTVKNRGKSTETKKTDNTEIKKEQSENTEDNGKRITGDNTNIILQQVSTYNAIEPGFSKNKNKPEIEGTETHLSVRQSKSKIYSKTPPESPQMIILPDTRETVIKNVAKMRATPLTPEIKVTTPEKVKYEEPVNVPKLDAILSEPGKVEIACTAGDNELPKGDEKRASNETSREGNIVNTAEPIGVTPVQQEMNVVCVQLDQWKQEVTSHSIETTVSGTEESPNANSGQSRGNDNTIPTISIACADEVTEDVHENSALLETDNVTCFSTCTVCAQSTEIISIKRELSPDSLAIMLRKAVGNLDHETSPSSNSGPEKAALQVEQNMSERKNFVGTQLIPDVVSPPLSKALPNITQTDTVIICSGKELKMEPDVDRIQREKPAMEKLGLTTPVGPTLPPLSPASLRRLMAKNNPNLESQGSVPAVAGDGSDKKGEDSGSSTPTSILSCESSPKMKRRDSLTLIPSATPEELASGARRKIYLAKTKSEDEASDSQSKRDMSPSQARRAAFLQLQSGQQTPPLEKRSPLMGRRKNTLEVPKPKEEASEETDRSSTENKTEEKEKQDPYKAPQVIRKIRGEPFSDALGHLKLWCQFFNVLSDSIITWFKDEVQIAEMKRSAGDESQVALAIVQASSRDCGVYGCTIKNEYGRDSTDFLLSPEILSEFFLRDDLEVGEEIEMTPLLFTKGLADPGYWGDKFFGRIMTEAVHIGEGCTHKSSRAKVIYGLDPVFESGSTCIVKVRNSIVYGTKEENSLAERNLEVAKQECKIQNTVREYCKIFAAEARVSDAFGFSLEVIPLYLMYRPANTIPYATVEANLQGLYLKYSLIDSTGELIPRTLSEVEQKCSTFQHWILQWTNGNLLVTQLEGVDTKITNIRIASKSKGYQGLTVESSPKVLEQFMSQHQCNYYCGLLGLRPLMPTDSLQQPKVKTSKSPLLARRVGIGSSANQQFQKKGSSSPQSGRKCNASPKVDKKTNDDGENKSTTKHKTVEVTKTVRME